MAFMPPVSGIKAVQGFGLRADSVGPQEDLESRASKYGTPPTTIEF